MACEYPQLLWCAPLPFPKHLRVMRGVTTTLFETPIWPKSRNMRTGNTALKCGGGCAIKLLGGLGFEVGMRGAGGCGLLGLAYVVVLSLPVTCCVRNLVSSSSSLCTKACKKRRWRNLVAIGEPRTVHERCKLPKFMLIACLAVRVKYGKYVLLWDAILFCRSEGPQEVPSMHV